MQDFNVGTSWTDRRLGALVHLASIPAPYLAPIIALVVACGRPFVGYHAGRVLVEHLIAGLLTFLVIVTSLAFTIYQLVQTGFDVSRSIWWRVILKSVVVWLALAMFGLWNTIASLREAFVANQGLLPSRMRWGDRLTAQLVRLPAQTPLG